MNNIVHTRIDDRFIHGQVANVWCTSLKIDRIIVANDKVAENEVQKSALRMSTPKGINTSLISVDKVITNINAGKYGPQRILILVNNPIDIKRLIAGGVPIESFNIGNMSKRDNTEQIAKSISITNEEKDAILQLIEQGTTVTMQMLPEAKVIYAKDVIRK